MASSTPSPTASYDGHNQVTWVANTAPTGYTYDAAGNVLSDGVNRYLYDGEGRLCAYQSVAVPGNYGPMMGYVYGPDGLRVGKGTITTWTCNPLTAGFAMTASYVLGPGGEQVSEMAVTGTYGNYSSSWQHTNVFANGSLLATYNGTETYFALSDWLGTKRAEITPDGQSTRFFQLPYGNDLTSIGSLADATEQHFTGKERDPESGLDYFGARYYASAMGRWLSPDFTGYGLDPAPVPWADFTNPQSLNLYSYVQNNPLVKTYPDGHACVVQTRTGNNSESFSVASEGTCDGVNVGDGQTATFVNGTVDLSDIHLGADGQSIDIGFTSYDGQSSGVQNAAVAPVPDRPGIDYWWGNNPQAYRQLGNAYATVGTPTGVAEFYGASALAATCALYCGAAAAAIPGGSNSVMYKVIAYLESRGISAAAATEWATRNLADFNVNPGWTQAIANDIKQLAPKLNKFVQEYRQSRGTQGTH